MGQGQNNYAEILKTRFDPIICVLTLAAHVSGSNEGRKERKPMLSEISAGKRSAAFIWIEARVLVQAWGGYVLDDRNENLKMHDPLLLLPPQGTSDNDVKFPCAREK